MAKSLLVAFAALISLSACSVFRSNDWVELPTDTDSDGVSDVADDCPLTADKLKVSRQGCASLAAQILSAPSVSSSRNGSSRSPANTYSSRQVNFPSQPVTPAQPQQRQRDVIQNRAILGGSNNAGAGVDPCVGLAGAIDPRCGRAVQEREDAVQRKRNAALAAARAEAEAIQRAQQAQQQQYQQQIQPPAPVADRFDSIYFAPNATDLTTYSKGQIKNFAPQLVQIMLANPWLSIELAGHADREEFGASHFSVSLRRADKVFDYLAAYGVPSERMSVTAVGIAQPVAGGGEQNRRVDVLLWQP